MTNLTFKKPNRGFTLIELLVVVAIIGTLSSVVLASLNDARARAEDTRRLQDMREIRKALELFHQEYDRYPDQANDSVSNGGQFIGIGEEIDTALRPYLDPIPRDPKHDGTLYFYSYDPTHNFSDCPSTTHNGGSGVVFGFNYAEELKNLPKETCTGADMNLGNADYNQALTP